MNNAVSTFDQYRKVLEFMEACSQEINKSPKPPSYKVGNLRISLIKEEIDELYELGITKDNPVEVLDALCDILYVVYGAMATVGISPEPYGSHAKKIDASVNNILPMYVSARLHNDMVMQLEQFASGLLANDMNMISQSLQGLVLYAIDMATECDMDIVGAFDEVHSSNMSKFCDTVDEATKHCNRNHSESIKPYLNPLEAEKLRAYNIDKVDIVEVRFGEQTKYAIKRKKDGKALKGPHFFEPNLAKFLK